MITMVSMLHYNSFNLGSFTLFGGALKLTMDPGFLLLSVLLPIYCFVDPFTGVYHPLP
jgi:hypothetical protein